MATAEQLLRRSDVGLLTLTGTGGSGKTRLALELAATLENSFPDGVVFVSLAALTDPELVAAAIGQALNLRDAPGRSLLDSLTGFLQDRAMLLVLDNFEHLLPAALLVAELLLRCPRLKVLVTSRAALHVSGEHELAVPPLAVPPLAIGEPAAWEQDALDLVARSAEFAALELFCARASAVNHGFRLTAENAAAVARICHRLDGLPLAIELAATWIKILSPAALLDKLEHRLPVLTGGARDLPARQRTLRDAIAWSYNLLTPAEQTLFRRLAVFRGGCTLEAIEAVCNPAGALEIETLDGVASLVDKHLLSYTDGPDGERRFSLLETIREFGLERLEASGEAETTRQQHAWYFVRLAEQAEPHLTSGRRASWLRRLVTEQDNLRAVLGWVVERDEAEPGLRLLGAAWPWYWLNFHEGRRWTTMLLALPSAAAPTVARAKALWTATVAAWGMGDFAAATVLSEENVAVSRALGDPRRLAYALALLGSSKLPGPAELEAIYDECIRAAQETGDAWLVAVAYLNHGMAAGRLGNGVVGRSQSEQAAARFRALGDTWLATIASLWRGVALLHLGEHRLAREQLESCLPVFRELRDSGWATVALIGLALIGRREGDLARAAGDYSEALVLCWEAGDVGNLPVCLEGLAAIGVARNRAESAARLLGAAQATETAGTTPTIPGFEELFQHTTEAVSEALGADALAGARAAGRALPMAEVVVEARELAEWVSRAAAVDDRSAPEHPDGLSAREVDVLRLLASGMSNREIAGALVLSVRTVEKHVANIYAKINTRGRADAATYALRRGLLPSG